MTEQQSGLPCIKCDSSDALTIYPEGTGYCFSCRTYFHADQIEAGGVEEREPPVQKAAPPQSHYSASGLPSRGLSAETLKYYGVTVYHSETNGEIEEVLFPVYRAGELVGHKVKNISGKSFRATGSTKNPDFFGQHKAGQGGKLLIITEGEEDCMSAHQLLKSVGKSYTVVSLPNGANSSAVKKNLEWIETFDTIILNLDTDEIGEACAIEIGDILTPGKVKIMRLPIIGKSTKDTNEFLQNGGTGGSYLSALWKARPYRPDGVVSLSESWEAMFANDQQKSILYPWDGLNTKLYGMREREIVTWTAGSGIGKSAVVRELEHHLLRQTQDNIGILALEESVARTAWGIVSVEANLPLSIREERAGVSDEDIREWFDKTLGTGRLFTLDHFGSTSEENLLNRIRYMIKGLGCKWIILDHLSIVVSAMDNGGDERRTIDSIMTRLRQLVEETGAGLHLVSHLRRVSGDRGHEQGVEVSLSHLRGSQAIAQLSDVVIAMERNQQALEEKEANLTRLRVLKNRYAGLTGLATNLGYDRATGRLFEVRDIDEYLAPSIEEAGV